MRNLTAEALRTRSKESLIKKYSGHCELCGCEKQSVHASRASARTEWVIC